MAISIADARALRPGALIQFGGPNLYEVVAVLETADGVHLTLKRDDGYDSFATHHDLVQANLRGATDGSPAALNDAQKAYHAEQAQALAAFIEQHPEPPINADAPVDAEPDIAGIPPDAVRAFIEHNKAVLDAADVPVDTAALGADTVDTDTPAAPEQPRKGRKA